MPGQGRPLIQYYWCLHKRKETYREVDDVKVSAETGVASHQGVPGLPESGKRQARVLL